MLATSQRECGIVDLWLKWTCFIFTMMVLFEYCTQANIYFHLVCYLHSIIDIDLLVYSSADSSLSGVLVWVATILKVLSVLKTTKQHKQALAGT